MANHIRRRAHGAISINPNSTGVHSAWLRSTEAEAIAARIYESAVERFEAKEARRRDRERRLQLRRFSWEQEAGQ